MQSSISGMILAAGKATRLGELSADLPKAMLPLCNYPLIDWSLRLLGGQGIGEVGINLHHLGDSLREHVDRGGQRGLRVHYSREQELLGTGGGIKQMASLLPRRTTLVVNGKIATDIDLNAVIRRHIESKSIATMVLYANPNVSAWGAINTDSRGRVVRLLDATTAASGKVSPDYMFAGIHILEPELIDAIPEGPCCVIRTAYLELLSAGAPIGGYVHQGYFYEHSTPARYLQGNLNLVSGHAGWTNTPGRLRGVASSAAISEQATVLPSVLVGEGVRIDEHATVGPNVVLGNGVHVHAGAEIRNSVVWPATDVEQRLDGVIATPGRCLSGLSDADPMQKPRE